MSKSEKEYKRLAIAARALGLAKYDSRNLTPGQKSYLTKLDDKYNAVLKNPKDYFSKPVKAKTADLLKKSGHSVISGRVIMEKQGFKTLSIRRKKSGDLLVKKQSKKRKTESPIFKDPLHIFKEIARLEKQLKSLGFHGEGYGDLGPYQTVTAKFGDKPFTQQFQSLKEFKKYLEKFPEDKLRYLSLVTYFD